MSQENSPYAATPELIVKTFRNMFLARIFEEKISALYRAGKIVGGVYIGTGQEAFSAALGQQLDRSRGDVYAPLIRDQAGRLAYGEPLHDASRTYLGSVEGPMKGRDGNIHRGRPKEGMPAMISHLGASVSVINGMMMAKRFQGKTGFVGAASSGDGMTSTGAFHEGLNQAAVEKLPLVVALANNQFAYSTPTSRQFACEDLADRAAGYGVRGYSIDGTDLLACLETFAEAIDRALNGDGPQLVVGKLLRLSGHGVHDDASYVPDEVKAGKFGGDSLFLAREMILAKGLLTESELGEMETELTMEVETAVSDAQGEDSPNPATENWNALSTGELVERMF
ncbi:thiamine pyrophosphate-dependent dehydrogenase E1 component subunit alpha [Verrucomicrobiales bacterium BCK34]|nr:thiamine pyrophosphate-dependent dehydrogenase E1 component subunit alpha [Verrucomicrobiales bacterium BCK34]